MIDTYDPTVARLQATMHAVAEQVADDAPPLPVTALSSEPQHRRRSTKLVAAAVATVVVATTVAGIAVLGGDGDQRSAAPTTDANTDTPPLVECPDARNPRFGHADALPAEGYTDEPYVREVAQNSAQQLRAEIPESVDIRVEPRNGEVWSYSPEGNVRTGTRNDFWIVVELASATACPTSPLVLAGVPVQFVAPGPPGVHSLTVYASNALKYDQPSYTVPAGTVRLTFMGGTGHTLRFDDATYRDVRLEIEDVRDHPTQDIELAPGTYTIYCEVPGHREAGMEATITAVPPDPTGSTPTSSTG